MLIECLVIINLVLFFFIIIGIHFKWCGDSLRNNILSRACCFDVVNCYVHVKLTWYVHDKVHLCAY